MYLSVVVPVYNEVENLTPLYECLREVLDSTGWTYELILVDDGSTDGSDRVLADLHAKDPRVKVLRFRRTNHRTGLARHDSKNRQASARAGVWVHLDWRGRRYVCVRRRSFGRSDRRARVWCPADTALVRNSRRESRRGSGVTPAFAGAVDISVAADHDGDGVHYRNCASHYEW